jgi:mono/diheme cytochrome c family protein
MLFHRRRKVRRDPPSSAPVLVARRIARTLVIGIALRILAVTSTASTSTELFSRQCSSCHTIGKGDLVGPDLNGVTGRRDRAWLARFIRSSREVVESGDPVATLLFERYKRQRMPDHDFTAAQIDTLLEYVSTFKAAADPAAARAADASTPADVRHGFDLFVGRARLTTRAPCGACHSIRHPLAGWTTAMATFAPELSLVYEQYHDKPLAAFFRAPCWPRLPDAPLTNPLTPDESFALRAFLRDAARHAGRSLEDRPFER